MQSSECVRRVVCIAAALAALGLVAGCEYEEGPAYPPGPYYDYGGPAYYGGYYGAYPRYYGSYYAHPGFRDHEHWEHEEHEAREHGGPREVAPRSYWHARTAPVPGPVRRF